MKIALVHDWLTGMRGGEYVLEAIAEIFPRSDLYTLLYIPGTVSPAITTLKRHTSWLQKVPGAERRYRMFLPFMPSMIENLDLSGFDLILSSSHCVAKGVIKDPDAVHVSYVHAPMRYMWDRFDDYFGPGRSSLPVRLAARYLRPRMQEWDRQVSSSERVDALMANSSFIARQIKECYGRESTIVFPYVNLDRFKRARAPGTSYLMVGAFAPNKRVDIAIEAFNRLNLNLYIIGSGQEEARLKKMAGPDIQFLGSLSNSMIEEMYSKCKAFIFPGLEDFGITPLEALASGAPVIAYGEGGVKDTITPETGLLFDQQTPESLMEAVMKFEKGEVTFSEKDCRDRARKFSKERFQISFAAAVKSAWIERGRDLAPLEERIQSGWADALKT